MTTTPNDNASLADLMRDGETEHDIRAYVVIGRTVVVWAQLEYGFSALTARLYHLHGGQRLFKVPPFNMKRKIEFWNDCFARLEHLQPHQAQARGFTKDLMEAKRDRDTLLHFAWDQDSPETLKGRSIRAGSEWHSREEMNLSLRAVEGLAIRTNELIVRLMILTQALYSGPPR